MPQSGLLAAPSPGPAGDSAHVALKLPLFLPILPGRGPQWGVEWCTAWQPGRPPPHARKEEESMGSAAVQGQLWGRAAHDWAELQEPTALPLWEAMLDAAFVGPGTRVLDAGCGAGGASVLAAGRGAHVNGLDAAEALLAIARARVPDADFRAGDLDALPYADGTFDAILAADVLPYVADPAAALRGLRRVCAPGARVVIAIWGAPDECELSAIVAAVREILPRPL